MGEAAVISHMKGKKHATGTTLRSQSLLSQFTSTHPAAPAAAATAPAVKQGCLRASFQGTLGGGLKSFGP